MFLVLLKAYIIYLLQRTSDQITKPPATNPNPELRLPGCWPIHALHCVPLGPERRPSKTPGLTQEANECPPLFFRALWYDMQHSVLGASPLASFRGIKGSEPQRSEIVGLVDPNQRCWFVVLKHPGNWGVKPFGIPSNESHPHPAARETA